MSVTRSIEITTLSWTINAIWNIWYPWQISNIFRSKIVSILPGVWNISPGNVSKRKTWLGSIFISLSFSRFWISDENTNTRILRFLEFSSKRLIFKVQGNSERQILEACKKEEDFNFQTYYSLNREKNFSMFLRTMTICNFPFLKENYLRFSTLCSM